VVSQDKDMKTLPVWQMNPNHVDPWSTLIHQSEEAAELFHYTQALTGDRTDNYFGCPGMGDVTGPRVFAEQPWRKWWHLVVSAYERKGETKELAVLNARLARILQFSDLVLDTDGRFLICPWNPPPRD
jgi:DNA polymerase-1